MPLSQLTELKLISFKLNRFKIINNVIVHICDFTSEPLVRSGADVSIFILQNFISRKFR